jgi:hypothetical protein
VRLALAGSLPVALAALGMLLALAGCESTQATSARLQRSGVKQLAAAKGLVVGKQNADVRVVGAAVVHDANGAAVVVTLRNRSPRPLASVPIAIDVRGAGGKGVYKNDTPGLDPSLVSVTALPARGEIVWVDDQVTPTATPTSVRARIGETHGSPPARLPQIELTAPQLSTDPVTGVEAVGVVRNRSRLEQRRLVVFCVARRGARVVAAGRAIVARLAPGTHAEYHVFFIGDPRGARLTIAAPPTVLE